ncbi:hypothetical protein LQZ19_09365 [Treponema primitia]|uniref:hypothetical protein n=1 Tax=Treponema primitia TaxID=88058 RepID=UPI00397F4542
MEELNAEFNDALRDAIKGEGEPVRFTEKEIKASDEKCAALCEGREIGKLEKLVRTEQAQAASAPDIHLTF